MGSSWDFSCLDLDQNDQNGDQAGEYRGGADASRWLGECVVLRWQAV